MSDGSTSSIHTEISDMDKDYSKPEYKEMLKNPISIKKGQGNSKSSGQ